MSGRYSAMGVSQQLAAPTYPKVNEYNKMEARERVRERPLTQELTGGRGRESGDSAIVADRYLGSAT